MRDLFLLPILPAQSCAITAAIKGRRRVLDARGYIRVCGIPGGWEYEHRLVAAAMLGRSLLPSEAVHHLNEVTTDNRPENLEVMTVGGHIAHHNSVSPKRHATPRAGGCL